MPIAVGRIVLSQYGSNTYFIGASPEAAEVAVVDPGGDPAPLLEELGRNGTKVGAILVTHADVDHIEGVAALVRASGAEVWAPAGEAEVLRTGAVRGGPIRVQPHDPEHIVSDGDTIEVAGIAFEIAGVPGHSIDHVAFYADGNLFAGDLLFEGSVGRVDLEGGDWETLLESVRRLLDRYPADTTVYPGHGGPTTLGRELQSNPFLGELRNA